MADVQLCDQVKTCKLKRSQIQFWWSQINSEYFLLNFHFGSFVSEGLSFVPLD